MDAAPPAVPSPPRPPRFIPCLGGLAVLWVLLLGVGWMLPRLGAGSGVRSAAAVVGIAVLGTAATTARRPLYRVLTSLPFAVALLLVLLVTTMVGTFVVRIDLFHTVWFHGFLALLAASLVLVVVRYRAWRVDRWGPPPSHAGVVLTRAGGSLGGGWGFQGRIDLHEGESVTEAVRADARGEPVERRPLGFSVRLEKFEIEHYPPEYRFYVYERSGESFEVLRSLRVKEAADWTALGSGGAAFRVLREFPDFHLRTELQEVPEGKGGVILQVVVGAAGSEKRLHFLAGVPGRDTADLAPIGGPIVRLLAEAPPDAEVARWAEPRAESHVLAVRKDDASPPEEVVVQPDGTYTVAGGWRVRVLAYLPDFVFDTETRKPTTRTPNPNNPALQVEVTPASGGPGEKRWLFEKMPDFGHGGVAKAGPRLVYRHGDAYVPPAKETVVVAKRREAWTLEAGRVVRREPLAPDEGPLPGVAGARARLYASAEEAHIPESLSPEWKNPVVEIELREGGATRTLLLSAAHGDPLRLQDEKTLLVFKLKPDDVKDYRARLAILEGERKVLGKTIEVNDPLTYGGYTFYQSNYRKEDPTYSGILVVKDPGLPLVWAGFIAICLGVIFIYYVRPRLARARASAAARRADPPPAAPAENGRTGYDA